MIWLHIGTLPILYILAVLFVLYKKATMDTVSRAFFIQYDEIDFLVVIPGLIALFFFIMFECIYLLYKLWN